MITIIMIIVIATTITMWIEKIITLTVTTSYSIWRYIIALKTVIQD